MKGEEIPEGPTGPRDSRRFVSSTLVRKLMAANLVKAVGEGAVRISSKGEKLIAELQNKPGRGRPRGKAESRSMIRGMTLFEFDYADETYTSITRRGIMHQARIIQAMAWKENLDEIPTLEIKAQSVPGLTDQNITKAVNKGLRALVTESVSTIVEPLTAKSAYARYLGGLGAKAREASTVTPGGRHA